MKMSRVVMLSDTHGNFININKIIKKQPDADLYIFLGDGTGFFAELKSDIESFFEKNESYRNKFIIVKGNCDLNTADSGIKDYEVIEISGHRIFAAHGHTFGINYGYSEIIEEAKKKDCDIILYGHTHARYSGVKDGIHIINPGSASCPRDGLKPSFGFIDFLSDGSFTVQITDI